MHWWLLTLLYLIIPYDVICTNVADRHEFFSLGDKNDLLHRLEYSHADELNHTTLLNCTEQFNETEFVVLKNGTAILTHYGKLLDSDQFYVDNETIFFCDGDCPYKLSEEFCECGHILIDSNEFELMENGSVFIKPYSMSFPPSHFLLATSGVYICVPDFRKWKERYESVPDEWQKFSTTSDYVSFVGLLISIVCLLAHLTVFCYVPEVRNLPGCCLSSLSLSLLMAYLCFILAFLMESKPMCIGLGICVYYFFLTSFFWMNAISFDFWRSFRVVVRELRISNHRLPRRRFAFYSLYSWGIPALLAIVVKLLDTSDVLPTEYKPSFGYPFCWFGQRKALLAFFAIPLIFVMSLNLVFFADVIYVINRATMKRGTTHDANLKKRFAMFVRLALIMGLTWIFGIAAGFVDTPVLWYIFIVFNTLQGLFIFAVFMGSSKVRSLCFKGYKNREKRTSTSVRTVSAAI